MKTAGAPSLSAATDPAPAESPGQPAGDVASIPAGPLDELHAMACEIADEVEAGEWVTWGAIRRYRAAKRKLAE